MQMDWIRDQVSNCPIYKSPTWIEKVKKMPDYQVFAIHKSFIKNGTYDNKPTKESKGNKQLTLYDIFPDAMKGDKK